MSDPALQIVSFVLNTLILVGFLAVIVIGVFNIAMERR